MYTLKRHCKLPDFLPKILILLISISNALLTLEYYTLDYIDVNRLKTDKCFSRKLTNVDENK